MAKKGRKSEDKQAKAPRKKTSARQTPKNKQNNATAHVKKEEARTSKAKQRSKKYLTTKELAYFQRLLLAKRAELIGDLTHMEDETLQKTRLSASGDLSSMPIHMADIGTQNYEQEFALGLLDSERKLLREINDALQRIADRTYGICEGTGKEIGKPRLEANPWARYCVEYARMVEQGLIREGDIVEDEENNEDVLDDDDIIEDEDDMDLDMDLGMDEEEDDELIEEDLDEDDWDEKDV